MMVAFLLRTTVSKEWLGGGVPAFLVLVLGLELDITLLSVTLTIVAFLCTVTCLEFGSMGEWFKGGEGDLLDWEERLLVLDPGRLVDLLTFLEEIVIEEKPALF